MAEREVVLLATHVSATSAKDPGWRINYANDMSLAADGV